MDPHITIKWLVTIVDRGKGKSAAKILTENHIIVQLIARGRGTAGSAIMHYLGLDEPEKDLVLSLAPGPLIDAALPILAQKLEFTRPGRGIAFTIPLSGISLAASREVSAGSLNIDLKKEDSAMSSDQSHDLIVSVVDEKDSDIVVDAAKEAGCNGGTVTKARWICSDDTKKVFGITIEPEKEIIMLLVPHDKKQSVLKNICNKILAETGSHGLSFSIPVGDVTGLREE